MYLNGRKLHYDASSRPAIYALTQEVELREGDVVVMHIASQKVAYRALRIGFVSTDKQTVLPLRIEHVRRVDGVPIDAIDIHAVAESHTGAVNGRPDESRMSEWNELGLPLAESEWMWGPERNKQYQLAFVVEHSKLKRVSSAAAAESHRCAKVPSPAESAPPAPLTTQSESGALAPWKEKFEYLQQQLAISADPAQKFALKKQIEEAEQKIRELG